MPSYKSVTEQAGIYAGKEGFDIKVENNTDLKGAVIASEADADKNTLTTGTISFSDIKNEAEYDTKGIGMTLDANKTSGNQPSTVGQKGLILDNVLVDLEKDAFFYGIYKVIGKKVTKYILVPVESGFQVYINNKYKE